MYIYITNYESLIKLNKTKFIIYIINVKDNFRSDYICKLDIIAKFI